MAMAFSANKTPLLECEDICKMKCDDKETLSSSQQYDTSHS